MNKSPQKPKIDTFEKSALKIRRIYLNPFETIRILTILVSF